MIHLFKVYVILIPIFFAIDMIWLGGIMSGFYRRELGDLARREGDALKPLWWAAIPVYLLIPLGIVLFVLPQIPADGSAACAGFWGFLYGIVLYGVYDFTNLSTLRKWPVTVTFADVAWGGVVCALASCIAFWLDRWMA